MRNDLLIEIIGGKEDSRLDETNIMAYLSISGDEFPIDQVTKTLGIEPTKAERKVILVPPFPTVTSPKRHYREMTFWRFSTGYQVSYDINNQLNYLLDVFEGKVDELKEIKEEYSIYFYFTIVINVENGDKPAIYFEKRFISFAAQLEAEVDVDWYIYS